MTNTKIHKSTQSFKGPQESAINEISSLKIERWLSSKEAAQYLGISVSALTMKVYRKEIRPKKLGRLNRFSQSDLDGLLLSTNETSLPRRF